LRSENSSSYRLLARHTSLPIAAGEQWDTKWLFMEMIDEELVNLGFGEFVYIENYMYSSPWTLQISYLIAKDRSLNCI